MIYQRNFYIQIIILSSPKLFKLLVIICLFANYSSYGHGGAVLNPWAGAHIYTS